MLGQFEKDRRFNAGLAADGCRQMLYGLFMKTVVGDNCARVVDAAFSDPAHVKGWSLLFAAYLFAFQIYGDFAGYSHMAIGCARLFGFDLMRNFAYPYFARSIAEFWHRWHISLSTWFRDYVYIPLGGNRGSPLRRRMNVFVTFVLSGIWHGAGFNFLIWGAYHGTLCAAQWWPAGTKIDEPGGPSALPKPKDLLAMIVTFHLVCIGWVFFRASDAASAWLILSRIADAAVHFSAAAGRSGMTVRQEPVGAIFALVAVLVAIEWVQRRRPHGLFMERLPRPARWAVYLIFLLAVVTIGRREEIPFIYFQF
jgi:D-alanyl-lipoteichoic acid acyltransferase DltB (MBOAT superfamily)